jgi:hypothetical protein
LWRTGGISLREAGASEMPFSSQTGFGSDQC